VVLLNRALLDFLVNDFSCFPFFFSPLLHFKSPVSRPFRNNRNHALITRILPPAFAVSLIP
jgi:hypothetical protein